MNSTAHGGPASVRRVVVTAAAVAAVPTLGLILYILVVSTRAALALRWYLLFVGGIGVIAAIRVMAARYPVLWRSSADRANDQPDRDELPQQLRAINRLVTRAGWDAAGFELELRPMLRAIAAQRLATYRTVDIDADPAAARAILGERVWTLLTPVDLDTARRAPGGVDPDGVRAAVETLEGLGASIHT
jgi:hypothetical protein